VPFYSGLGAINRATQADADAVQSLPGSAKTGSACLAVSLSTVSVTPQSRCPPNALAPPSDDPVEGMGVREGNERTSPTSTSAA
jgi:hypothetical protein